jgi:hypothetical protein
MPDSKLHFIVPLHNAWTDAARDESVADITLEPEAGRPFEFSPIGGVLGVGSAFATGTEQWRARYEGKAQVTASLHQAGQPPTTDTLTVQFAEPRPMEIDFAEVTGRDQRKGHVLLRGSVRVGLAGQNLAPEFQKNLAALWPVADTTKIVALRLEPAGLYLEGKLPAAMFPSTTEAVEDEVTVVLRVPQQEWDVDEDRAAEAGKRFWTLESFDFGQGLPSARVFLLDYGKDLDGFNKPDRTFIDNVAASPGAETALHIFRPTDHELIWAMTGSRVLQPKADELKRELPALRQQLRIQFGGGEAGEAAFHPDELTGKVKENNGAWKRIPFGANGGEGHHVLVRTKRTGAEPEAESAVALGMSSDTPELVLTQQKLAALSLPALPLKPPVVDKPLARGRSWLCTDQGWLAVDAAPPPKEAGAGGDRGAGAIQGVIELEKLMAHLQRPQAPAAGAGPQPEGQAAAGEANQDQGMLPDALQVQLVTAGTTSVTLGMDYDQGKVSEVHLFLGNPLTTVITPSVWYAAPSPDQAGAVGAQPSTAELLPAWPAAQDASSLESMFQKASFISPDPDKETPSDGISAAITWGKTDNNQEPHFSLRLQATQLRLWHPIPDVPLAQSFGRTPDPSRDSTLDANRGLIPFEPAAKSVTLEFHGLPAIGLPSVDGAPKAKNDLGGFTIPASRFPRRYFLPTLPGVEATLPVKPKTEGEPPEAGLRWGYRHAVPALDEAYAEVVEDPAQKVDAVQIQGGLDFTRVAGAEAFEIRAGDDLKATGWLRKTKDNPDPDGEAKIKIENLDTDFKPEGRVPHLQISLADFLPQTVTFGRTEDKNTAGLTGRFSNGQEIANNGQWLGVGIEERKTYDGAGLETSEITGPETKLDHPGQPETRITGTYSRQDPVAKDALTLELLGVRIGEFDAKADLSDQRWMLHDGNGDWPSLHGWPLYPVKLTELRGNGISPSAAVIEAVLLPRVPAPPVLSLETGMLSVPPNLVDRTEVDGTNLDGSFTVKLLEDLSASNLVSIDLPSRWPLHPPQVSMWDSNNKPIDIKFDQGHYPGGFLMLIHTREVVPKGEITVRLHTAIPQPTDGVPAVAGGRLMLTLGLDGSKIVNISVASMAGQDGFDWRFKPIPSSDVSLLRLSGTINALENLGLQGSVLASLELKHPLGVIDLKQALHETHFKLSDTNGIAGELLSDPPFPVFIYDLEVSRMGSEFEEITDPYRIKRCVLTWRYPLADKTVIKLLYGTDTSTDALRPCGGSRWCLSVCDNLDRELLGPLCLKTPITVDKHRFLYEVDVTQAVPDSGDSRAWLKANKVAGVVGVEFSAERLEIKSLTAEIQVSMGDRYPDDAIALWDPVDQTLHSMDRNVGAIGPGALVEDLQQDRPRWLSLGPATLRRTDPLGESDLVYWADKQGTVRRWRLGQENTVARYRLEDLRIAALLPADLNHTLVGVEGLTRNLSALTVSPGGLQSREISPGFDFNAPITAAATAIPWSGFRVAWWKGGVGANGLDWFLATWHTQEDTVRQSSFQGAIVRAMAFLDEDTVMTADDQGRLLRWELAGDGPLQPAPIAQGVEVTAMAVVERNARLVSAHADGSLWLRDATDPVNKSKQIFPSPPTAAAVLSLQPLPDLRVPAEKKVRFAALYDDGTVAQFEYATSDTLDRIEVHSRLVNTGDCRPTQIGALWGRNNEYMLLALAGPSTSTQLAAQLHLDRSGLSTELTGRLTIQNRLDYVIVNQSHPTLQPHCTHRIDLYFDRAQAPAEAVFWSEHHGDDTYTAALANHVFRFPDGHERIWQAPQMIRITSLGRFAQLTDDPSLQVAPDDRRLVLDASAVFWLKPAALAESMRYGVGAAAIANDSFRLWLRPQELRSFEAGEARAVRLPAIACWAFNNAPFEVRAPDAPKAPLIEIQEANADPDLDYWSSGVQQPLVGATKTIRRTLTVPTDTMMDDRPTFFARGEEAAWLASEFLRNTLHPLALTAGLSGRGVRPGFGSAPDIDAKLPKHLNDLLWLKDQRLFEDISAMDDRFLHGDSAFLASATLAHRHDPAQPLPALDGPTLFEFPYRLRLEEMSSKSGADEKFDVQLLVFDKEVTENGTLSSLKCVARDRLAPEAADQDKVAERWGRALMEERRRYDAAFVLVNFAKLIPVPRRFEAMYEELPFALDAPLGGGAADTADPRRRLPGLQRIGKSWQRTWLQADPTLGLRVFAAEPAAPTDKSQKIVAATRFRLARAGGDSHLAPALDPADGDPAPALPQIVALSQRDDVLFEVQIAQGYPLDEGRKFIGQPAPTPANLVKLRPAPTQEDGQPASLLPPLVDIVSWAARPGEMTRSAWSADIHEFRGGVGDPGLQAVADRSRHPVSVSLRRPRARAGQQEAVRLLPKLARLLFHDRFRQAEFLLQQDLERTTPDELGQSGVQLVVVTQADVFKSATSSDAAKTSPAFFSLLKSPAGDPLPPVVAVYLVARDGEFEEMLAPRPANEATANAVVALHKLDGELSGTSESFFTSPPTSPLKLWKNGLTWESLQINDVNLRWTQLPVIDVQALLAQLNPDPTGNFVLAQYAKIEEPPASVSFAKPVPFAYVTIKRLAAANFTPPKMSLSLLSWPQSAAGSKTVALAGYGHFGPEDFSLIQPRSDGDGLAWSRTAGLRVIHRAMPDHRAMLDQEKYGYDVVAYGPGGELIRTETP